MGDLSSALHHFALLCVFLRVSIGQTPAALDVSYEGSTEPDGMPDIFVYNVSEGAVLQVQIMSLNATNGSPLIAVARGTHALRSAKLPLLLQSQYAFSDVTLTLCPFAGILPSGHNETQSRNGSVFVELSSAEPRGLHYTMKATLLNNVVLSTEHTSSVTATPSSPLIRYFAFSDEKSEAHSTVLIRVQSESDACVIVSVQPAQCPFFDQWENVQLRGLHETVTRDGAITVSKADFPEFFLVLVVAANDLACIGQNSLIPLGPVFGRTRTKKASISLRYLPDRLVPVPDPVKCPGKCQMAFYSVWNCPQEYLIPISVTFVCIAAIYLIVIGWSTMFERRRAKEFREKMPVLLTAENAQDVEFQAEGGVNENSEQWDADDEDGLLNPNERQEQGLGLPPGVVVVRQRNNGAHREAESEYSVPADRDTRNGFRSAVPLMVSHLAAKSYKQREKKYKLYIWNFLTISCFYSLPVVQLVFVWNRTLANSGNLDLCWYNELCSRSFFGITAFNAVFSNIGYIMLGLLFNVMVGMRDIRYNSETLQSDGDQNREIGRYGLPQHFGLLYCIGCAIMMEGVLSASYHICPSSTNFQFDTAFMYMIAALGLLRIYQMRHPDINANSHVAYATMAGIILFGMVGVYFNSAVVYALFSAFYAVILISVSCEFYYKGSWKLNVSAVHPRNLLPSASLPSRLLHCVVPAHKGRFMFLIVGNAGNVALLIYGLLARPTDFPSFLLTIFIMNLLLYTFYYIVMKIRFREYLSLHSVVVIILAAIAWSISLFFYMQKSTSWHIPPADSRTMNRPCVLFDFYDLHDCWHFSSALALFLSFTTLLCIDDNVRFVPQNALRVF